MLRQALIGDRTFASDDFYDTNSIYTIAHQIHDSNFHLLKQNPLYTIIQDGGRGC